jgi:non-ribosomal peptide synthetase component F
MRVISGGEALDATLAAELLARAATVWNAYGPTEATVTATSHRLAAAPSDPIPLGRPFPGVHTYVLDRCGRLVPPGVTGELWVGGAGVARGYHGDPERTAAAFVRDPYRPGQRCYRTGDLVRWRPDGLLEFAGRRDHQVKLHGYRIELGEIEAALRAVPGVADAAVTVRPADAGPAFLVGHLAPRGGPLDLATVEAELRAVLPAHQVPRRWTSWPVLPRTTSGKLDRIALAAAPLTTGPARAPASDVERYLQQLWSQLLGRAVTVDDDFFGAGGDSIAATRVAARLASDLGVEVGARLLFEHPVLADFAVELERLALAQLDEADEEPR